MESAFGEFKANANLHKDSLNCFATTEAWHSEDAVAGKKLMEHTEANLLDEILQLQNDILEMQEHFIANFKGSVDDSPIARI